jgi:hypothetical protein
MLNAAMAAPEVAPRKQEPKFNPWGVVRGAGKGVPAGVAEMSGSTADILGAFGNVNAATGAKAGGMFASQTEAEQQETDKQAKKLREQGMDFRSDAGGLFRGVAQDYMPDPQTAHGAEQAVAEFSRLATKAVIAGATMGPLAGAVAAGTEEGFTTADKLANQGVDVATRTEVGALTGSVTALGFALPVAGSTVAKTVGLAVAGGPASFVAQQAATREILQNADYTLLADQYDPLDPVGLTLSTLVPLGFGAAAMRGAARKAGTAAKAAKAMEPPPKPVAAETVDAARVQMLRDNVELHRVTPPEDFAAASAHETAVTKAIDQIAGGQRVEVAQAMPDPVAAKIAETVTARMDPIMKEVDAIRAADPVADRVIEPARAADAQQFDIATLARDAEIMVSNGRTPGEIIGRMEASGRKISPELQNMIIAASEFGRRMPELIDQFRTLEAKSKGEPVQNLIADAVEKLRTTPPPDGPKTAISPSQARLEAQIVGKPMALDVTMPTAFDDAGRVTESVTARDFLRAVEAEAARDTTDASLLQIAANCFLSLGA